ncbi:MFS transporter [Bacillus sp. ISL-18]|uniref:MFS transporter n=1 Tax=Bacillus sp. ISL-18 TaxID=2819118 RepID=UPI002035B171|nr:MFS transporter [Bacillus sp. ISL-18]
MACIGAVLLFTVTFKLEETLPKENRVPSNLPEIMKNFGSLFRDRSFLGYALTQGFTGAGIFAYVSGVPFVYQNIYGVTPQQFSLLFGTNGLAFIIGSQLVGRLADTISERTFLKIGLAMTNLAGAALLIAMLLKAPLFAVVIPIFIFTFSLSIIRTTSFTLAIEKQGHIAGSASALLGLLPFVLGSLTAPLVGVAGTNAGIPMGILILFTSLLAFLSYYGLVSKTSLRKTASKSFVGLSKKKNSQAS